MTDMPTTLTLPPLPAVDIYGPVHRGLRRELCLLLDRMGTTSLDDARRWSALGGELEGLLLLIEHHLRHEEEHSHRALSERAPQVCVDLDEDHREHRAAHTDLRALSRSCTTPAARRALYLRYAAYVGESLVHMTDEEIRVQSLLSASFSSEELRENEQRLLASIAPAVFFEFMRVMLPAQAPEIRQGMLAKCREAMPPEAFAALEGALARAA